MNSKWFKEHVCEELDSACEYVKMGIELRAMQSTWADKLVSMSAQELEHAKNFYNMFEEYVDIQKKEYGGKLPYYIAEDWEAVASCFERKVAHILQLHGEYKPKSNIK